MSIDELFTIAVEEKASDLHLVVGMPPILRIDGNLKPMEGREVLSGKVAEELVYSILTPAQKALYIKDRELDLSYELKNLSRFRVNLHWEKDNVGMVARVISKKIPTMKDIQMPEIVFDFLGMDQGLVIITGPTGCGKSTTLAAMVDHINTNKSKKQEWTNRTILMPRTSHVVISRGFDSHRTIKSTAANPAVY